MRAQTSSVPMSFPRTPLPTRRHRTPSGGETKRFPYPTTDPRGRTRSSSPSLLSRPGFMAPATAAGIASSSSSSSSTAWRSHSPLASPFSSPSMSNPSIFSPRSRSSTVETNFSPSFEDRSDLPAYSPSDRKASLLPSLPISPPRSPITTRLAERSDERRRRRRTTLESRRTRSNTDADAEGLTVSPAIRNFGMFTAVAFAEAGEEISRSVSSRRTETGGSGSGRSRGWSLSAATSREGQVHQVDMNPVELVDSPKPESLNSDEEWDHSSYTTSCSAENSPSLALALPFSFSSFLSPSSSSSQTQDTKDTSDKSCSLHLTFALSSLPVSAPYPPHLNELRLHPLYVPNFLLKFHPASPSTKVGDLKQEITSRFNFDRVGIPNFDLALYAGSRRMDEGDDLGSHGLGADDEAGAGGNSNVGGKEIVVVIHSDSA